MVLLKKKITNVYNQLYIYTIGVSLPILTPPLAIFYRSLPLVSPALHYEHTIKLSKYNLPTHRYDCTPPPCPPPPELASPTHKPAAVIRNQER